MSIAWLKHEPELEIPQVVKGEGLHDCMTGGGFSFHKFDFAPAKNFIEKKSPRQHGVPAQTAQPTRGQAPSGAKSL
jgi:hypothetical protein